MASPVLIQSIRVRGSELLRFGDESQQTVGASLLQRVEEQGGLEGELASSELCRGGAESKRGCSNVERVVGGTTQVMQNLEIGHVALLAGIGLLGQVTRNGVMGWMGRSIGSWWNRGKVGTVLAKGAGVTTEVVGITGIGVMQKLKSGESVHLGEEVLRTGVGWLGLRLGMEGFGIVPKAVHQWGRHAVPRLMEGMGFTRIVSTFVGGMVGMVGAETLVEDVSNLPKRPFSQKIYQAAITQGRFMVGMKGLGELVPVYPLAARKLHVQSRSLAARLDFKKHFPPNNGFGLANNFAWATAGLGSDRSRPILFEGTPRPTTGEPEPPPPWPERVKAEWLKWLEARPAVDRTLVQEKSARDYPLVWKGQKVSVADMMTGIDAKVNGHQTHVFVTIRGKRKLFKETLAKATIKPLFKHHENLKEVCFVFADGSVILFTRLIGLRQKL